MSFVKFAFLMELRTNAEDSEWMNEYLRFTYFIERFFFPFFIYIFFSERDRICYGEFPLIVIPYWLTSCIIYGWSTAPNKASLFRPGFCIAQLNLNLQHEYVIRYDLRGYSEFFTQISTSVWFTQVTSAPTFSRLVFPPCTADIPTYCPEIESFAGS